jgi:hypothetical protein
MTALKEKRAKNRLFKLLKDPEQFLLDGESLTYSYKDIEATLVQDGEMLSISATAIPKGNINPWEELCKTVDDLRERVEIIEKNQLTIISADPLNAIDFDELIGMAKQLHPIKIKDPQ